MLFFPIILSLNLNSPNLFIASYEHYNITRGAISVPQDELHQIDASSSSQVCDTFGIHPNLPHLKTLYDENDLLWVANMVCNQIS